MNKAYLAGFFDGEGSIGIYRGSGGTGWHLRTQLTQNDTPEARRVLDECVRAYGGHVSVLRGLARVRPGLNWQLSGDRAASMLADIYPYLVLKREQARVAIYYQAQPRGSRHDGPEVAATLKAMKRPWVMA